MNPVAPVMQEVTLLRATSLPAGCSPTRTLRNHRKAMRKRFLLPAALALMLTAAVPAVASASEYVPGQVIVKYKDTAASKQVELPRGDTVKDAVSDLREDPDVAYAVPNYIAHASATPLVPNDPAFRLQWNFAGPFGINMPEAWGIARARHAPGGRGAVVAVLDTGVAYRTFKKRYRRAPD